LGCVNDPRQLTEVSRQVNRELIGPDGDVRHSPVDAVVLERDDGLVVHYWNYSVDSLRFLREKTNPGLPMARDSSASKSAEGIETSTSTWLTRHVRPTDSESPRSRTRSATIFKNSGPDVVAAPRAHALG
jgi:hypothetical protein